MCQQTEVTRGQSLSFNARWVRLLWTLPRIVAMSDRNHPWERVAFWETRGLVDVPSPPLSERLEWARERLSERGVFNFADGPLILRADFHTRIASDHKFPLKRETEGRGP